ncbi:MAG: cobalt-precorrin-7 (C(5))-methyltransferase, partial [Pseudomonadota bacterium]
MTAWLDVIGLGEDGLSGLAPATRARLEAAEIVVGSARHHALTSGVTAKRIDWPTPFRAMLDDIGAMCGQQVAVLVTGDPLWYSVGAQFAERFPAAEVTFHPQLSAFQLAACRLG